MDRIEAMETDDVAKTDPNPRPALDLNENLDFTTRVEEHEPGYSSSTTSCSCDDHDASSTHNEKDDLRNTSRDDNANHSSPDPKNDRGIIRNKRRTVYSSADSSKSDESRPRARKLNSVLVKPDRSEEVRMERERKALLESQRGDTQAMARNKRMFGMLMGTLKKFKTEESGREEKMNQRTQIEEKLEQKTEVEYSSAGSSMPRPRFDDDDYSRRELPPLLRRPSQRDRYKDDDDDEMDDERPNEEEDKAGKKLDVMGRFKNWERTHKHLCGFIQTETKPRIFWLPREHNTQTERRLRETKDYFGLCIAERTAKYKSEMATLNDEAE